MDPPSAGVALAAETQSEAQAALTQLQAAELGEAVRVVLLAPSALAEIFETVRSLQTAIDNIPAPIFSKDANGTYRACNKAFEAFLGLAREEIIGRTVFDIAPAELATAYAEADRALLAAGGCQVYDASVQYADGSVHDVTFYKGVFRDDDGIIQGLSGAMLDITERRALEMRLESLARTDPLTGLGNRAAFSERLETATARAGDGRCPALLLIDLDDFKTVNDTMGHEAGDELLIAVGQALRASVRPGDTVARLGGDEFAVLVEDILTRDIPALVRRIADGLARPVIVGDQPRAVAASVGVAYGGAGQTGSDLLRNADLAMYAAKEHGKGRCVVYDDELRVKVLERVALVEGLQRAVDAQEMFLEYQPIVAVPSGTVVGVEALVRWRHRERGVIGPQHFVPVAESSGLIVPLGSWVIGETCRQAAAWRRRDRWQALTAHVNVSVQQLREAGFVAGLRAVLDETGLDPDGLVLEVTETAVSDDLRVAETLHDVRALGVRVALDDFGTGQSSLARLSTYPVNILKIDKSCIDQVATSRRQTAIVSAVHQLAQMLDLSVIAEGVETAEQLARLTELGYQYVQGFLFAAPQPAERMTAILAAGRSLAPRSRSGTGTAGEPRR